MRPSCIPLLISLAFLGLTQAKAHEPSVKTICNTAYCGVKGTRTRFLADETIVIQKPAPPCKVTTSAVFTPRARTITSIQPVVSTTIVTEPQKTDIATSTSFDFSFVFPTTTSYTTSTPVSTSVVTVANPNDITTTTTSYTIPAPAPSFANQRRGEGKTVQPRGGSKEVKLGPGYSPARLGKNVYCHREITTTTTFPKPCKTVTSYSVAPRPTSTTVSTFLVSVTQTAILADVTSTVTVTSSSTVTAPTNTFTVTKYAATSTTTSTTTAAVATTTVVVGEYALCDPNLFSMHDNAAVTDPEVQYFSADDAVSCCHSAISVPNAILFGFGQGICAGAYSSRASQCPSQIEYIGSGSSFTLGTLECGSSS